MSRMSEDDEIKIARKRSRHLIKPYITFPEAETCYKLLLVVASLVFALISPEAHRFC